MFLINFINSILTFSHFTKFIFIYFYCAGSLLCGLSVAAAHGLLIAASSLVGKHELWGAWASVVAACGLGSCDSGL